MHGLIVDAACIAGTLAAYVCAVRLARAARSHPLLNPVLVGVLLVAGGLAVARLPLQTYIAASEPFRLLLGPATVALAIPLYRRLAAVRRSGVAVVAAVVAGSAASTVAGIAIAAAFGAPAIVVRALLTKSVTAAAAVGIASHVGADPTLAAALSIAAGMAGAVLAEGVLGPRLRQAAAEANGLAVGVTAHGIGTAVALRRNADAGAFATVGMGANALLSALVLPIVAHLAR
jgi:putative effector of murein hydrolase